MAEGTLRPTRAEVDLDALRANVRLVRQLAAPAEVCAVVKADGYGLGAVRVGRAALEAGAAGLAVALVEEGIELRQAGVTDPILVLAEPPAEAAEAVFDHKLTPTVYSEDGLAALRAAAAGGRRAVHVKVDTGMHRVGLSPSRVVEFVTELAASRVLAFEGFFTHFAVADGGDPEDREFTERQIERFERHLGELAAVGIVPAVRHAANSAATIAYPSARFDLVRDGIALYGEPPSPWVAGVLESTGRRLRPVLSLLSEVVALRRLDAGERPSYGRARPLPVSSMVATVPIGYADGVSRRLFESGGDVLIAGRRRPLAGVVTMDQIVVDCGPDGDVSVGDEVVLIGRQGDEEIGVTEWARRLGTIPHEVLTAIGPRVPRVARGESSAGAAGRRPVKTGWRRRLTAAIGPQVPEP